MALYPWQDAEANQQRQPQLPTRQQEEATEAAKEEETKAEATEAASEAATTAAEAAGAVDASAVADKKVGISIYKFDDNFMTLYRTELVRYLTEDLGFKQGELS